MAVGVAKKTSANCAISVTGIAGPDGGTPDKPVGTVYAGFYYDGEVEVVRYNFTGDRQSIRKQTVGAVIDKMIKMIE
jgi:PncC family amidohydrolase